MAEELLLYVVPIVVVLATCLLLYLCSIRPGQVNQPDFAILSAQQQKISKQAIALSATDEHHGGSDIRVSSKGSTRSSSSVNINHVTAKTAHSRLLGIPGNQQYGSRNRRAVVEAVTASGGLSKQQRKLPLDSHETNNRRRKPAVATSGDLEFKSSDAQTDRSSGISSIVSDSNVEDNGPVVHEPVFLALSDEPATEHVAETNNDNYFNDDVPATPHTLNLSQDDDDEGIAISTADAHPAKHQLSDKSNAAGVAFEHASHSRKQLPVAKHAHASTSLTSSPHSPATSQHHRAKRYDNDNSVHSYSQQTQYVGSNRPPTHAHAGDGWKVERDAKAGGERNSLVFVNSKQQQQAQQFLRANGPATSATRSSPEKHSAAWNGDSIANGIHNNYYSSDSSPLANGRKPPPYYQQRQQQHHPNMPTSPRSTQSISTDHEQQKTAARANNENNCSVRKTNDFPVNNPRTVSPTAKPREQATIYQHKFSGVEHSFAVAVNSNIDHIRMSNIDEQVQTNESLADWLPVILDAIFAEVAKNNEAHDTEIVDRNYAEDEQNSGESERSARFAVAADTNESSCQTVLACGYVEHAQIDPALSGLVIINQDGQKESQQQILIASE